MCVPIDPPSPVAVARALCEMIMEMSSHPDYETCCVENVYGFLTQDPPDLLRARAEIMDGLAHAFRPHFRERGRPAIWVLAACRALLHA